MKVIIPVAGIGERLRPHTYLIPKALLMVADKPILGHILEKIRDSIPKELEFTGIVFIVSYMKDKIKEYVNKNYNFNTIWVEQKERLGLGHAVWLTQKIVNEEPAFIVYGDTIFMIDEQKIKGLLNMKAGGATSDGCLGVDEVEDPTRFGTVELKNGFVKKLVEKPLHPTTNLAIVGINFIQNTQLLFSCLEEMIAKNIKTRGRTSRGHTSKGEFQLTDAFQLMLGKGAKFKTFKVENWFDCGTPETLLNTNRKLLSRIQYSAPSIQDNDSSIKPPVFIHQSAKIRHSIIGPYVSISRGANIKNSIISDSIINQDAKVENLVLTHSIISANNVNAKIKY